MRGRQLGWRSHGPGGGDGNFWWKKGILMANHPKRWIGQYFVSYCENDNTEWWRREWKHRKIFADRRDERRSSTLPMPLFVVEVWFTEDVRWDDVAAVNRYRVGSAFDEVSNDVDAFYKCDSVYRKSHGVHLHNHKINFKCLIRSHFKCLIRSHFKCLIRSHFKCLIRSHFKCLIRSHFTKILC